MQRRIGMHLLLPAEPFVAAVMMQRENGGQRPMRARRLQEDALGRRAIRKLPAQFFDVQTVMLVAAHDFDGRRRRADIRLRQPLRQTGAGRSPPCLQIAIIPLRQENAPGSSATREAAQGAYAPMV